MTAATAVVAISIAESWVLPALPAPAEEKPVTEAQRPVPRVDRLGDALARGAVARHPARPRLRGRPGAKCVFASPERQGALPPEVQTSPSASGRRPPAVSCAWLQLDLHRLLRLDLRHHHFPGRQAARLRRREQAITVYLQDLGAGKELWRRKGNHPELDGLATGSLAFSPDSKTLAVSTADGGTVALSEVATGKQVRQIRTRGRSLLCRLHAGRQDPAVGELRRPDYAPSGCHHGGGTAPDGQRQGGSADGPVRGRQDAGDRGRQGSARRFTFGTWRPARRCGG